MSDPEAQHARPADHTPLLPPPAARPSPGRAATLRRTLRAFLSGKWGHYFVIVLVAVDVACIFAGFLVALHVCEASGDAGFRAAPWQRAIAGLGVASLVVSSLFVLELLGCVFAFGFG